MLFALLKREPVLQSKCLIGGWGNAGMRPERRFKPGMDGGLTAAVLLSPPHLAESRDNDTGKHLERMPVLCGLLATEMSAYPKFSGTINGEASVFGLLPVHGQPRKMP
jgi:hypothetical protein